MVSRGRRVELGAIFAVFLVNSFAMSVSGPLLADIQREFQVGFAVLGLLVSMQSVSRVALTLPVGYLADRCHPRFLLTGGALLLAVGAGVTWLAPSFGVVLAGALVVGAGTALGDGCGITHLVRLSGRESRGRTTARLMTGFHIGPFLSPLAAGALASALGWRAAFVLTLAIALAAGVMTWTLIRAPLQRPSDPRPRSLGLVTSGIAPQMLALLVFSALLWGGTAAIRMVALPLYGSVALGYDAVLVGLFLSVANGIRALAVFLGGTAIDQLGRRATLAATILLNALGGLALVLPAGLGFWGALGACYALGGVGASLPVVLLGDRVPPDRAGRFVGAMQFLTSGASMVLPPVLGFLLDLSGFGALGGLVVVLFGVALVLGLVATRSAAGGPRVPGAARSTPSPQ